MSTLPPTAGLRHVAFHVKNFDECLHFYRDLFGMQIEWQPDPDNIYLTSGFDNLALHRAPENFNPGQQRLDHIGFILNRPQDVDAWYAHLKAHHIKMHSEPKDHRDGARSFYCEDPDSNIVQMIFHPPLAMPA